MVSTSYLLLSEPRIFRPALVCSHNSLVSVQAALILTGPKEPGTQYIQIALAPPPSQQALSVVSKPVKQDAIEDFNSMAIETQVLNDRGILEFDSYLAQRNTSQLQQGLLLYLEIFFCLLWETTLSCMLAYLQICLFPNFCAKYP